MRTVAIDARMIRHSGIGVVLRGLLRHWADTPPFFRIALCGPKNILEEACPTELAADIIHWDPPVYTMKAAFSGPKLPGSTSAWYSPHYATCLRPGVPLVCHVQDILHYTHPQRAGSAAFNRIYLEALRRRAAFTLTTTRHVKVQLQTLFHFHAHRVLCTGLGPGILDVGHSPEAKDLPHELTDKKYILNVGIDKSHKNWDFLLSQFAKLEDESIFLAGAGLGEGTERIRFLAGKLGIQDRIVLLPHLCDKTMAAVYSHAVALTYPSIAEGFGLPVLEAMGAGTPVLLADRSPMKEIAGDAGHYFEPDYQESFGDAFRCLLSDAEETKRRVESGKRIARQYTWQKTAQCVEDALSRTVEGTLPIPRHCGGV